MQMAIARPSERWVPRPEAGTDVRPEMVGKPTWIPPVGS